MKCIQCDRSAGQVPLLMFQYKGGEFAICPEHLPILIHKPAMLEGKIPDAGGWHHGEDTHEN
jgi:hypothetical protein